MIDGFDIAGRMEGGNFSEAGFLTGTCETWSTKFMARQVYGQVVYFAPEISNR